jgi:hypothetical protein
MKVEQVSRFDEQSHQLLVLWDADQCTICDLGVCYNLDVCGKLKFDWSRFNTTYNLRMKTCLSRSTIATAS